MPPTLLSTLRAVPEGTHRGQPLSRVLMDDGVVAAKTMLGALAEAGRLDQPVAQVVRAENLAPPEAVAWADARRHGAPFVQRATTPPDLHAMAHLPAAFCLEHGILPWTYAGTRLVIATSRPDQFDTIRDSLPATLGEVMMAVALETEIHALIGEWHGAALARQAEHARPSQDSCRDLNMAGPRALSFGALLALSFAALLWAAPNLLFAAALVLALTSMIVGQALKVLGLAASPKARARADTGLPANPPKVSLLVPLHHEADIASTLVARLSRLTYPRALLEVLLVLEEDDKTTQKALQGTRLPYWVRTISVPGGAIKTKPRAMNYALRFTTGSIIGVYDAEDAPAPDQIDQVVAHFARRPARVGCVQGILDFYNPNANWLSRCFAIEYASWFRVLLPGLSRVGLAVPLGGTTVFFRRAALLSVGGWDAHNVTEDADLGFLLARRGYVTELIPSVTREEANNRLWPWVRQRSRWLKGYAITWWVHSRRPRVLWRDLGPRRFLGMQALLLSTILQFALAPVLWSFWLILLGLPHPLDGHLSPAVMNTLVALFLSAEGISILLGIAAVTRSPHAGLLPWVPTLFAYFPLGTVAIYKALWQIIFRPYYWDKTQHGHSAPDTPGGDLEGR